MSTTISLPEATSSPALPVEQESRRAIWTRESVRCATSLGFFAPARGRVNLGVIAHLEF